MDTQEQLLDRCREAGLRITRGLQEILRALLTAELPQSLLDLEAHPDLKGTCDRTTIFRTLQRLESVGLLRRLNFARREAKFTLNTGRQHREYLICAQCGEVRALEMSCPVHELETRLSEETSYQNMTHELTFYGTCPTCATA